MFFGSKNYRSIHNNLLNICANNISISYFQQRLKRIYIKIYRENRSVYSKKLSVACTQTLPVLFSLDISLIYNTTFFIGVFAQFRIFQSFTRNVKKVNKFLSEIGCPQKCIDKCIFKFLNSIFQQDKSCNGSKEGSQNCSSVFKKHVEYYKN